MWEQAEEHAMTATSISRFSSWNITDSIDQRDDVEAAREDNNTSARDRRITTPHNISTTETPPSAGCHVSSPPKVKRMAAFCFDSSSNGCEQLTQAVGRVLRSLSPPPIKHVPSFSFDNLILMGYGKAQLNYEESTMKRSDTYLSSDDEEEDEDDTSSLEYSISDDDSAAVERAILASAAFPVPPQVVLGGGGDMPFQCPICLDCTDSSNIATVSGCAHNFCFKCVVNWAERKNECPLCKETFHWVASCERVRWY